MKDQSQKQHEDNQGKIFLFLYALSQELIDLAYKEGFDVSEYISRISKKTHVESRKLTKETIKEDFALANQFKYIIILGHHDSETDSLVLSDETHLPMIKLVSLLPQSLQGLVIDLAICKSRPIADDIKKQTHCNHVLAAQKSTDVKTRLYVYDYDLFDYLKANPEKDYKEAYVNCLNRLKSKVGGKKNLRPSTTKLGTMSTSTAPLQAVRNSPFHVKVFIHADGEEADIIAEIGNYQRKIRRNLKLDDGKRICWDLSFDTDPEAYENLNKHIRGAGSHSEIWNSEKLRIEYTFKCFVKPEFTLNGFNGVLKTTIGDKEPETWSFSFNVEVVPYKDGECKNDNVINSDQQEEKDNIINVSYDAAKNAYGTMCPDTLKKHIKDQIKETEDTHMRMSPELQQEYKDILSVIDKMERYDERELLDKWKRLYICDKRFEMLKHLENISDIIKPIEESEKHTPPVTDKNRSDIRTSASNFFKMIEYEKIDIEVFYILKSIYIDDPDEEMSFFYNMELRQSFNGLAIKMAYKEIDNARIFDYIRYQDDIKENNKDKLPQINWKSRGQYVNKAVVKYIRKIVKDKRFKMELEQYLKKNSLSVFASYLKDLCE